jgi:hypothetical protein
MSDCKKFMSMQEYYTRLMQQQADRVAQLRQAEMQAERCIVCGKSEKDHRHE